MGASRGDFHKYPRTPHLLGSKGTSDDKRLGKTDSTRLLQDPSLIIEEKLDGTNVGIHFSRGQLILQCRGHEITAGMHPQYDLFKQWAFGKRHCLEEILGERYLMYGEWLYARHCIEYRRLPHYFFEFDILDKNSGQFLTLASRLELIEGSGIETVPVLHRGTISREALESLIGESNFGAQFIHPQSGVPDNLMEGLYLRTESHGTVEHRAKFVRPEFVEKIKQSSHWQYEKMVPNQLAENVEIW